MSLIVHPHLHFRRTGVTRHVEEVVRALGPDARAWGASLQGGVPRLSLGELLRRARSEELVWHAHRNNELVVGLLLRALLPAVRTVYTRHAATRPSGFTRLLYRRADRVVALTAEVASQLEVPCEVVGHGVDLERFAPPQDRAAAWRALGAGGTFGVGVVGRIRPSKGQGDFVEAISPLLAAHPEWKPVLVGRAKRSDMAWAQSLVAKTGGALLLAGEQRDVAAWYRGLSVVVQPSHSEGFSLVLLEAMASGCCVVAAQLPHYSKLIDHGRTGLLYPVGQAQALRELLVSLMNDPSRAAQLGRAAADEARRRFGIGEEAASLRTVYARLSRALPVQ